MNNRITNTQEKVTRKIFLIDGEFEVATNTLFIAN